MLTAVAVALVSFALLVVLGVAWPRLVIGLIHVAACLVLLAAVLVMGVIVTPFVVIARRVDRWRARRALSRALSEARR